MTRRMKDSGIEWIGEIPEDWEVVKVKDAFTRKNIKVNLETPVILSLARDAIKIRDISTNEGQLAADYSNYNLVEINDLLLNPMDLISGDNCNISKLKGVISPAYINLRYKPGTNPEFYNLYFKNLYWTNVFFAHGKGVSFENRWTLNYETLSQMKIPYPPSREQDIIVNVLLKKLNDIDNIKNILNKEIQTLEAYKKSLITEAVTKGLDKNVDMKDSGIELIGEIPKHWEVSKIKYNLTRKEERNPGNQKILSVYREYGVIPKDSRDDNHNVTSLNTSNYKYVKPDYLVINKMKAWQGSMGISRYEGVVSPAYYIYIVNKDSLDPYYLHNLLRSVYPDEFRRISGGIREGQWDLSAQLFEDTLIPIPPKDEQFKILKYIDTNFTTINRLIRLKEDQVSTLEEYKKSLIYEYVTGKKEVDNEICTK